MCGFCGYTGEILNGEDVLKQMMEKIIHRGPDSDGMHIDKEVALGFRRLSIIGLETGSQPMYNEDGSVVITFNGEIYNYQNLKDDLIAMGHIFKTDADTEVLIHGYEQWGEGILQHLRGMFAFVIWDSKAKTLFGARDFFGIKPFYYGEAGGNIFFGSEIKALLPYPKYNKKVNTLALENYLTFQYSVLPETFFKGIYKLAPGHYLKWKDGELSINRYFEPKFSEQELPLEKAIDDIDKVMQDSIRAHKISDVEVGSFLSSGVDSSYVAACAEVDKTFTVGFDYDNFNEIDYAKRLSDKIEVDNYSKLISTEEFWEALPKVQYHMDEPLADASAIALYFVSQTASKYVKVALSGEGADEFFGGYNIYREPIDLQKITSLPKPFRKLAGGIGSAMPKVRGKSFLIRGSQNVEERFIGNAKIFSKSEREKLLKRPYFQYTPSDLTAPYYAKVRNLNDITKMQYIDVNFWLVGDILLKADKMSMAHSLEVRVPFLDKKVFSVASKLPVRYKVNDENTKFAMRQAAHRHLPKIVSEKKKLGFPVPIRIWLREDRYYNKVKAMFTSDRAGEFFHQGELVHMLNKHKSGKEDLSRKIWVVYMFLVWHERFFA